MSRNNFGEFMEFFLKGLNTFKVQASLKFDLLPKFLIQNPEGFGGRAKRESCSFWSILSPCNVWKFWNSRINLFLFYKLESV
jgi:hypothetical protein